jgi:hypothetical protein
MSDHISIVTQRRPAQFASATNLTSAASVTAETAMTSTQAPPTASGNTVIVPGVLNYLKVIPMFLTGTTSPAIRATGWSYCKSNDRWFPSHLCKVALTLNSNGNSINGATLLGAHTMGLTSGDAKLVYEGTTNQGNGFILIDTVGADLIELSFETGSGTVACNAIISEV